MGRFMTLRMASPVHRMSLDRTLNYTLLSMFFIALAFGVRYYTGSAGESFDCRLSGRVSKVIDGDSIIVRDNNRIAHEIRLSGIDAPEFNQPYGRTSQKLLRQRINGKAVCVDWYKEDRYQRLVGVVRLEDADINLEQVKTGRAWFYKRYSNEQSAENAYLYEEAEAQAMQRGVGLWAETVPVAPWQWREGER